MTSARLRGGEQGSAREEVLPVWVLSCVYVNDCKEGGVEVHFCPCNLGKTVKKHYFPGAVLSLAQTHRGRPQTTSTRKGNDFEELVTFKKELSI